MSLRYFGMNNRFCLNLMRYGVRYLLGLSNFLSVISISYILSSYCMIVDRRLACCLIERTIIADNRMLDHG